MILDWTVVLFRPVEEKNDIYVAHVMAEGCYAAVTAAQMQVFVADTTDGCAPATPEQYKLCIVFEGTQQPRLYGWSVV